MKSFTIEKNVVNGKKFFIFSEQDYTEARAGVFAEEFGEPVEV